jgi:SAM-dependent methyltransferase
LDWGARLDPTLNRFSKWIALGARFPSSGAFLKVRSRGLLTGYSRRLSGERRYPEAAISLPRDETTSLVERERDVCPPEECDTFQFMAKRLHVKVLHPGGLAATDALARKCGVSRDTMLLDAGCGRGSSTVYLARRYGCRVVGVDLDQNLVFEAQRTSLTKGTAGRVAFRVADINALPFENGAFDGAIVQAVLIFAEKNALLRHLYEKIRPGGFIGVNELTWKKTPPEQVRVRVARILCSVAVNAEEHYAWADLLRSTGFAVDYSEPRDGGFSFIDMFRNEGLLTTLGIMAKSLADSQVRTKLTEISRLFKDAHEYLGYGLYVGRKD